MVLTLQFCWHCQLPCLHLSRPVGLVSCLVLLLSHLTAPEALASTGRGRRAGQTRNCPKNVPKAALVGVPLAVVAPQDTPKGLGMGASGCLDDLAEALLAVLASQDAPEGLGMGAFGCLDALAEALFAFLAP